MKRTICSFLCVFALLFAFGQSLKVKDFRLLDRDQTANTFGTRRIAQQNGDVAALIKIVTTATDLNFDGGNYSLVGNPVYNPGEIWIYVPAGAQKISIMHKDFGVLRDYYYPCPIEAARTYEMIVDLGVGKYATIQTSIPRSTVYIDGDSIGESPIYNRYILYGKHKLTAYNDKMEGEVTIDVINDGDDKSLNYTIPMVDQSVHFGQVVIETEKDAEIIFQGNVKGIGTWRTELREGDYVVETSKVNAENSKTSFRVLPQRVNTVHATAPIPHKGILRIFTRPKDAIITIDGKSMPNNGAIELPVGIHTLKFDHKDYYSQQHEYDVKHNVTLSDTVNLQRVQYLKEKGFYFGGAYTVGAFSGATGILGVTMYNIDLQASYTFGLSKSNAINHYTSDGAFRSKTQYSQNTLSIKLGYQISLATKFGIVPQVGYSMEKLSGKSLEGSDIPYNGAVSNNATIGGKFIFSPFQHFCLFAAPEYSFTVSKDKTYDIVANAANFKSDGFYCNIGILLNF